MKFGNLFYLLFLWLIPLLVFFYYYSFRKRAILLKKFANNKVLSQITNLNLSKKNAYLKSSLVVFAMLLSILALTEPKFGYHWEDVTRRGQDIVIAVDLSKSMLAEDIKPNRLERAKRKIQDFLTILEGDRLSLVAFAGSSFLQCPLTLDYEAFQIFLEYLEPSLIPIPGTSLTNALETSIKAFPKNSSRAKSIILITDGEEQEDKVNTIIPKLKEQHIRVFTIGIGKEEGVPIPDDNGQLKRDENGKVIMTKLDSTTLKNLAEETKGLFVRSVSGDIDIKKVYFEGIKAEEDKEFKSSKKQVWQERFQIFVALALLLVLLEFVLTERVKPQLRMQK